MPYLGKQPAGVAFDASDIADNSITAAKIVDGAITAADIATGAVDTAELAADAVTRAKIEDNAVDSEHIAADSIDAEHYAAGSVDTTALADDAVTEDKLANAINTAIAANTAKVTNATHTGDVTGSGALTIAVDAVDIAMLSATGTASSSTYLRGDNAWAAAGATGLDDVSGVARATSGLLFGSDTATANTLDDYEEGTFTLTAQDWSSATFSIGTVVAAKYTKIGNAVSIWWKGQLVCDSGSPGGGDLRFNGFPFGTTGGAEVYADVIFSHLTTNQTNMWLSFYGSSAYLYCLNSSGDPVDMTASVGGTNNMSFNLTYMTN